MADSQDRYAAEIRRIYELAELRIIEEIRRRAARGIKTPGWAEEKAAEIAALRAWLNRQLPGMLGSIPEDIRKIVQAAWDEGAKDAGAELVHANMADPAPQAYSRGASVRALASETVDALSATHLAILRTAADAYRDVVSAAAGEVVTGVAARQAAVQRALNAFADKGVTGFVDAAGRRWDLGTYADMALRSAVIRASVAGKTAKYLAAGVDLVMVSWHSESCPICNEYEGRVLSLTGNTAGYPTLNEAAADGLFHPNCRHAIQVFTPGLSEPENPGAGKDPAEVERAYAERMTQRRLERGVRQWKRRAAAALDDGERARCQAKQAEWTGRLKAHIEAVNARRAAAGEPETMRMPYRERTMRARPKG